MNQDLLDKIGKLIFLLSEAQQSFAKGSAGFNRLASSISVLNAALSNTSGIANLKQYETQLNKFFAAVERGENIQIRLGQGNRLRTGFIAQQSQFSGIADYSSGTLSEADRQGRIIALRAQQQAQAPSGGLASGANAPKLETPEQAQARATAQLEADRQLQIKMISDEAKLLSDRNARIAQMEKEAADLSNRVLRQAKAQERLDRNLILQQDAAKRAEDDKIANDLYQRTLETSKQYEFQRAATNLTAKDAERAARVEAQKEQYRQTYAANQEKLLERQRAAMAAQINATMTPQKLSLSIPSGEFGATAALEKLQGIDPRFTADTIRRVTTESSTGISRIDATFQTASGAFNNATVSVDRFGKVLVDSQKRFRSFGDNVIRDITEVAKWSIAVAAIYGPMQKFTQLMQDAVDIEFKLSDVTVALAGSTKTTAEAFTSIYDTAQKTGESILGVTQAYVQAYRAAGGAASETERFANAQKLLTASITLSKLSGVSQTEAIDTLSAALRQAYGPQGLGRGEELLNKWIRTSRIANVDLNTLAQGFSVVGETALDAGLSVDQLNGIIASVAETSSFSATEVANATKAIIASFQSDATKKQLDILGVAYQDLNGNARSFLDIANEINRLSKQGIITPEQMSALTLAQGGGPRRQPIVAAFYASMEKLPEIAAESAKANANTGESFNALQSKLDNVKTASEQLNNTFIALAETMGTKGGLLDATRGILNGFNGLVGLMTSLADVGGKSVPILLAVGAAMAIISKQTSLWKENAGNIFESTIMRGVRSAYGPGTILGATSGISAIQDPEMRNLASLRRESAAGTFARNNAGTAATIGAVAAPAIINILSGQPGQAAGNIIGGSIVGAITKSPLGAIVGASIGEAFYSAVDNFKPQFTDIFKDIFAKSGPSAPGAGPSDREQLQKQASENALEALGGGSLFLGKLRGAILQTLINASGNLGFAGKGFQGVNQDQATLIGLELTKNLPQLSPVDQKLYAKVIEELQKSEALRTGQTPQTQAVAQQFAPEIRTVQEQFQEQLRNMLASGVINPSKYQQGQANLSGFNVSAPKFASAFGGGSAAIQQYGALQAFGDTTTISTLNTYAEQINAINEKLSTMKSTDEGYVSTLAIKNDLLAQANALLKEQIVSIANMQKLLQDVELNKNTKDEGTLILERARKLTQERYDMNVKLGQLTEADAKVQLENLDKLLLRFKDGIAVATDTTAADIQAAKQQLIEEKVIQNRDQPIGFQKYDLTKDQLMAVFNSPGFKDLTNKLTGAGYQLDETAQIAITKEGAVTPLVKDWKLVEYYLNEILKVNQKQLDGMYNLPEGGSFFVPYNAKKLEATPVDNTQALNSNTDALHDLSQSMAMFYKEHFFQAGNGPQLPAYYKGLIQPGQDISKISAPNGYNDVGASGNTTQWKQGTMEDNTWNRLWQSGPRASQAPETIGEKLSSFMLQLNQFLSNGTGAGFFGGSGKLPASSLAGVAGGAVGAERVSEISTRLNLNINSSFQVNLNGQVLAKALKQILTTDLLKYGNNSTAVTRTTII